MSWIRDPMRYPGQSRYLVIFALLAAAHGLGAQTAVTAANPVAADQTRREQAAELFNQGKRLEALPLLEELAKVHPRESELLVALAACLVEHAASMGDEDAAGRERLRARDLLRRARDLGNTSTLALNLAELLDELPASGTMKFSDDAAVEQAMRTGEAAFSRRQFDIAIQSYSRALELDPRNYTATLFIANTYDKKGELRRGAAGYERAIRLDPNIETAYRYYADMLAREGEMTKARRLLIHAAVAEPYNGIVWRELRAWATINGTQLNEVFVAIPALQGGQPSAVEEPPQISAAWQAYRRVSASWRSESEFKSRFPEENGYRHSLPEEAEALAAAAKLLKSAASDPKSGQALGNDPNVGLLLRLYDAGLIEAYVLFSLGDRGIAQDYAAYRAKHRGRLEEYLDRFVVPPPGSRTH
jgi:tetratricopeptide (TPR) repeat protein